MVARISYYLVSAIRVITTLGLLQIWSPWMGDPDLPRAGGVLTFTGPGTVEGKSRGVGVGEGEYEANKTKKGTKVSKFYDWDVHAPKTGTVMCYRKAQS